MAKNVKNETESEIQSLRGKGKGVPRKFVPTQEDCDAIYNLENMWKHFAKTLTDPKADIPVPDSVHGQHMISEELKDLFRVYLSGQRPELLKHVARKTGKAVKELCYHDEIFFRSAMLGLDRTLENFVQVLTGDSSLKLNSVEINRELDFPEYSLKVDAYCDSADAGIFAVRLFHGKDAGSANRTICEAHAIGLTSLRCDQSFEEMKPVHVIYLTDADILGSNEFIHWESLFQVKPLFHMIHINCSYAFDRVCKEIELKDLLAKAERETDEVKKEQMRQRIRCLEDLQREQDAEMKAETARYGISEDAWRELLVYGHDFMARNWTDIQNPDLAKVMRMVKTPIAGNVSLMGAAVWNAMEAVCEEQKRKYAGVQIIFFGKSLYTTPIV